MEEVINKLNKINIEGSKLSFKEWKNYGKERIYVNAKYGKNYSCYDTFGYIENNEYIGTNKNGSAGTYYKIQDAINLVLA